MISVHVVAVVNTKGAVANKLTGSHYNINDLKYPVLLSILMLITLISHANNR